MAVAVEMDFAGATLEQYGEVMKLMSLDDGSRQMPNGGMFHWVAKTDDGIRVVDVWESKEQFARFAPAEIGPYTQQAGVPNPPRSPSAISTTTCPPRPAAPPATMPPEPGFARREARRRGALLASPLARPAQRRPAGLRSLARRGTTGEPGVPP
jgi:hypothetical protein